MDRESTPQPMPALEGVDDLDRRCGRCRTVFDDDPALDANARKEWALCAACEAIMFPRRSRSTAILTIVPPISLTGPESRSGEGVPGQAADGEAST